MGKRKATIRKYGDRRLYDSSGSRYVKLEDIARMIREGVEVEVIDAKTGKDITRVILTQIVMEDARGIDTGLPVQLLRQLVVASDRATHEFLSWYLENTHDLYEKAQDAFESRMSEARRMVSSPFDYARRLLAGGLGPSPEENETERLRRQVAELEAQIAELQAPGPRRRARPATKRKPRAKSAKP